jgi:glycoside/pentoside/hexuronide:cation symporter, GPH family
MRGRAVLNSAEKLSWKEKIGFSLGDGASNLFFQTFILFLLYFYTDVFGLPAAAVGTMFLVTRIWDAFFDPIIGLISDRTETRWGKFRPFLLWFALPFAIIGVLTFTTPGFDTSGKLVYAYITYSLMMMIYSAINVPYSALMGVITSNSEQRTILSSYRFVAAFSGGFIVQAVTIYLVKFFGHGDAQLGWQMAMGCIAGLAFVLFFLTFLTTKERVSPPKEQKSNFKQDFRDLFANKPWLLIAGATIFQLIYIVMRSSSVVYYFKYYVGAQDVNIFGSTIHLSLDSFTSSFLMSGTIATVIGAIMTKWFSKTFDKKTTYLSFLIASAVLCSLLVFLRPQDVLLIYGLNLLVSFFFGPVSVLQWAMYTDAADYSEWKRNRRATGLVMAASLFSLKLGLSLGGAIVGWILAYHGFVANEVQSAESMKGIVMLMSVYPAVFGVIGGLLMIFYPLTNRMMIEIEEDLAARRRDDGGGLPEAAVIK